MGVFVVIKCYCFNRDRRVDFVVEDTMPSVPGAELTRWMEWNPRVFTR